MKPQTARGSYMHYINYIPELLGYTAESQVMQTNIIQVSRNSLLQGRHCSKKASCMQINKGKGAGGEEEEGGGGGGGGYLINSPCC